MIASIASPPRASCLTMQTPSAPDRPWWWIVDPRLSLRARTALIVGGLGLLAAGLASHFGGRLLQQQLERQLGPAFENLAYQVSDKLDRRLDAHYRQLRLVAQLPAFLTPDAATDRRTALNALLSTSPDLVWIAFANLNGRIVSASQSNLENTPLDERLFRAAREGGYASEVHDALAANAGDALDAESARLLHLVAPVMSPEGAFVGALVAQVRWSMAREAQLSVVPDTARRERLGVTIYGSPTDVLLDSGGSGWSAPPGAPTPPERRRARGWFLETTVEGAHYLTGFARSRDARSFRGLPWLVAVRQPVDYAFAPVQTLRRTILTWGLIATALGALAGWVIAGRFARRMAAITAAAHRVREGDVLTVMPQRHGNSELARMCGALDAMVETLRRESAENSTETNSRRS